MSTSRNLPRPPTRKSGNAKSKPATTTLPLLIAMMALLDLSGRAGTAAAQEIGSGSHTYRWVKDWLKLLPGMVVGKTHGDVVIDARDRIYFSTDTSNAIFVVDAGGRVLRIFGHELSNGAHGLRLSREGRDEVLWVAHITLYEVRKYSLEGKLLMTLGYPESSRIYKEAKEFKPTAVDVAPNGDIYVADGYGKHHVHQWTAAGGYVRSWNGEGGAGKFNQPHGIGIDARGAEPRVVVADRQNHRLQVFTLDGKFAREVSGDFRLPSKIVVRGDDMVVPDLEGRITILNKDYEVVAHLGDNADPALRGKHPVLQDKWKDGEFIAPHGAAWDSRGNLYVQDWNVIGRMTKLERVGRAGKAVARGGVK